MRRVRPDTRVRPYGGWEGKLQGGRGNLLQKAKKENSPFFLLKIHFR
jgi:hypothetical protein